VLLNGSLVSTVFLRIWVDGVVGVVLIAEIVVIGVVELVNVDHFLVELVDEDVVLTKSDEHVLHVQLGEGRLAGQAVGLLLRACMAEVGIEVRVTVCVRPRVHLRLGFTVLVRTERHHVLVLGGMLVLHCFVH